MSILKSKRNESTAEYVNIADLIYEYTLLFMTKLSNRYQRLLSADTMRLASEVIDNAEKANNIKITDNVSYELRRTHLLEARSVVMAFDVHMAYIWRVMMTNPQGCFTNTNGETKTPKEAKKILNKMADDLGNYIDEFKNKVSALLISDTKRYKEKIKNK